MSRKDEITQVRLGGKQKEREISADGGCYHLYRELLSLTRKPRSPRLIRTRLEHRLGASLDSGALAPHKRFLSRSSPLQPGLLTTGVRMSGSLQGSFQLVASPHCLNIRRLIRFIRIASTEAGRSLLQSLGTWLAASFKLITRARLTKREASVLLVCFVPCFCATHLVTFLQPASKVHEHGPASRYRHGGLRGQRSQHQLNHPIFGLGRFQTGD